jgi:hypothetical protein
MKEMFFFLKENKNCMSLMIFFDNGGALGTISIRTESILGLGAKQ